MSRTYLYTGKCRNFLSLMAKGFIPDIRYIPRFIYILLMSCLFKPLRILDSFLFRKKIKKHIVTKSPIFILGHMRSGTTHLHNLLSLDPRFAAPKTFDAYAFDLFLTGNLLVKPFIKWLVPKKEKWTTWKLLLIYLRRKNLAFSQLQLSHFSIICFSQKS